MKLVLSSFPKIQNKFRGLAESLNCKTIHHRPKILIEITLSKPEIHFRPRTKRGPHPMGKADDLQVLVITTCQPNALLLAHVHSFLLPKNYML